MMLMACKPQLVLKLKDYTVVSCDPEKYVEVQHENLMVTLNLGK